MSISALTLLGLLALADGGWAGSAAAAEPRRIELAFRYDDFSSRSPTALEEGLFRLFAERGLSLTVGVTPFIVEGSEHDPRPQRIVPLGEEKFLLLEAGLKAGFLEPALHGYSHQTLPRKPKDPSSELIGLGEPDQRRRIEEGKRFLESRLGRAVDLFIPPWNSYDQATLRSLEALGFRGLSDQLDVPAFASDSLSFLPSTAEIPSLKEAIGGARRAAGHEALVVLIFHPYDLIEADAKRGSISLEGLAGLLDWVTSQKDVRPVSMGELLSRGSFSASLLAANKSYHRQRHLLPAAVFQASGLGWGAVFSPAFLAGTRPQLWAIIAAYGLAVLGLAGGAVYGLASRILSRRPRLGGPGLAGALLILAGSAALTLHDLTLSHRGLLLLLLSLSLPAGLWAARRRVRRPASRA